MDRSMIVALVALSLASSAMAQTVTVNIVKGGQFYHRPQCLVVEEQKSVPVEEAIGNGIASCPECSPAKFIDGVLRDDGPSPFFKIRLASRIGSGEYSGDIKGRVETLKEKAAKAKFEKENPEAAAALREKEAKDATAGLALGTPGGPAVVLGTTPALSAAAAAGTPPKESTATGNVPGTGGLLQALQFAPSPMEQSMTYYGKPIAQPSAPAPSP